MPGGDTGKAGTCALSYLVSQSISVCGGRYAPVLRFCVVSGLSSHRKMVVPPTVFLKQVYWYGLGC